MKLFLKKILPETTQVRLRAIKRSLDFFLLRLTARTKITSAFYYTFLSKAFWREHQAVAFGRLLYEQDDRSVEGSLYLLRRNIHQLEKGLIMKPRRPVFALDYIAETVRTYRQRLADSLTGEADQEEILWATDVLTSYFNVVGPHPVIEVARQAFTEVKEQAERLRLETAVVKAPYKRDLKRPLSVSYDQLLELARRRRSVRWFLPKSVPRELIDQAITVAALSPSACNRQPFVFHLFDNQGDISVQQVASLALGTIGFNHNFPALAVVVGRQRAYFSERDRHLIYIDGALASMSFVFALETLGLSSCCINWADTEAQERQMASLLNLQPDERVVMLIAIGYPDPDERVPYSGKKMLHTLRRYR
jgi:nitroreductase